MVEVTRQQGFVRAGDEDDDEEHRVREWEDGLPSLADLISLSQCLISPQLASAFSITSPSPAAPLRSSADVALASHAAFSSLLAHPDSQPPAAGDGHHTCVDRRRSEDLRSCNDIAPNASFCDDDVSVRRAGTKPLPADDARNQDCEGDASQDHFTAVDADDKRLAMAPARLQCLAVQGDEGADITERNVEHDEGEGYVESNVRRPCVSEGSDIARRVDVDVETEEAESTPSASENPNGEAPARTLKRPRLVWTPELHKRFVDAVTHLGLRTAVPKSIMQLMNVEGLTRENVASHLQKYRLYLKRMQQGLGGEDHIFASTPLPGNLSTSGRFLPPVPAHLQDVNQVPFLLHPGSSVSINRGHVAGVLPGPLAPVDPYSYSAFARPAHRVTQQNEFVDVHRWRQHQSDPNHSVLRK